MASILAKAQTASQSFGSVDLLSQPRQSWMRRRSTVDTGADRTILASEVAVELRLSHGEEVMLSIDYGLQESSPPKGVFAFSTNGNGAIDGWSISLDGSVPGPGGYTLTATSVDIGGVGGDAVTLSSSCTAYFSAPPGAPQSFSCGATGSNSKAGVWTPPAARAPEIDPASVASGLTLLLGGIAVMCGRRKLG
jgi:hypothetical protein